jgi:hypothetical protein
MAAMQYQQGSDPIAIKRQREAVHATKSLKEATGDDLRDRLVTAILETIRLNAPLRSLAFDGEMISRSRLRKTVKDYAGIDFSPIVTAFQDFLPFLQGRKQRKAVSGVARGIDDLLGSFEVEPLRANLVWVSAAHFQTVLRARRVSESDWRRLFLKLAHRQFLAPSSLLYFWCTKGPEAAFSTSFTPVYLADSPLCPLCGRVAQAICTFVPAGCLQKAMESKDGMLGVAVGWFFRKHEVRFKAGHLIGGTELDFVASGRRGRLLVECKMHHVLTPEGHIRGQILASRNQLRDHIHVANREGLKLAGASCVVNLTSQHLKKILRGLAVESDEVYQRLQAEVISYEDFADWFRRASVTSREGQAPPAEAVRSR